MSEKSETTPNEPQDFDDMVFHNMVAWRKCANWMEIERDALRAENARLLAVNARLREALQHADAAMDSLMSDEMPYTESCRIWRTAAESIRAALEVKP
jgi:hypothetical protein